MLHQCIQPCIQGQLMLQIDNFTKWVRLHGTYFYAVCSAGTLKTNYYIRGALAIKTFTIASTKQISAAFYSVS